MKTTYITYCKNAPTDEHVPTEFEFAYPAQEHDAVSHELVNVQVSGPSIYYTFRLETRPRESGYQAGLSEEEEVGPFER